jgi:maltose alpha-D-glucosyltransferase/alpha-amylase
MTQRYWWKEAKIYECYVDKFAGDFKGLTEHANYFSLLGVNCIHILPHYPSPMIDDGYDIMDYRNVRPELGTLDDFRECIKALHARGIRVILDFVLNHTSSEHPWFIEARSSKMNSKRDFFLWSDTGKECADAINAFPDIKSSNWIPNPQTGDHYFATFYPEQPDLNWDNPEVMEEMLGNMDFWVELGVDGFRLDAAPHLIKRDGTNSKGLPETHAILKNIRAHIDQHYPEVILLAEAHQSVAEIKTYFGNGDECHMAYHFCLMEQMLLALKRNDRSGVQKMLDESFDIPETCQWAVFLRNHDEISLATLPDDERTRLVDFLDPKHEYPFKKGLYTSMRLASIFHGDRAKLRTAFELLYSTPGAPVMYYGDEIGMKNLPLMPRIVDSRKYVRGPFLWQEAERQIASPDSLFHDVAALIEGGEPEDKKIPQPYLVGDQLVSS